MYFLCFCHAMKHLLIDVCVWKRQNPDRSPLRAVCFQEACCFVLDQSASLSKLRGLPSFSFRWIEIWLGVDSVAEVASVFIFRYFFKVLLALKNKINVFYGFDEILKIKIKIWRKNYLNIFLIKKTILKIILHYNLKYPLNHHPFLND